jgi:hypothetical protein
MKKVFCIVVCLILVCAIAIAESINWANLSDEEITAIIEAGQAELKQRKATDGENNTIIKDGTVLIDYEGITVTVEGDPRFDDYGDSQYINFTAVTENSSDTDKGIATDNASVNGWECFSDGPGMISAHKKSRNEFCIYCTDADIHSLDEIEECFIRIYVYDENYHTIYEGETKQYYFN